MEDMKEALQTAIAGENHAQLSIMYMALQKECNRLKLCLESKTEIANQLKDGMADMFEKSVALQAERDALASRLSELKRFVSSWDIDDAKSDPDFADTVFDFILEDSEEHLAAHDAEVAKKAVQSALRMYGSTDLSNKEIIALSESYAASLSK